MFPGILNPNIISDFASNLWFRRRRFFCVLTSQGHSDLLFQARSTIWTNLHWTWPYMLLCKFHQNQPSSFRGVVVLMSWRTNGRTDGHTLSHAISSHGLLARWAKKHSYLLLLKLVGFRQWICKLAVNISARKKFPRKIKVRKWGHYQITMTSPYSHKCIEAGWVIRWIVVSRDKMSIHSTIAYFWCHVSY